MNFIILHGTLGNPDSNWFPWLSNELEQQGHKTIRPQLPTPEGQTLDNWVKTIADSEKKLKTLKKDLIIVAHSLSALAACHYLTKIEDPVCACVFAAPFAEKLPNTPEPYPTLNNPFIDADIDWIEVKAKAQRFICFSSDDDPYVPPTTVKNFVEPISGELFLVPLAGHFNTDSGYTTFPLLLTTIQSITT